MAAKKTTKKVTKKILIKPSGQRTKTAPAQKAASPAVGTKKAPPVTEQSPALVGKKAPAFKLRNQNDQLIESSTLAKKPYVLYFYPKDNTPGCTVEACDFRDGVGNFLALGVTVLGVSPDSAKSHAGFAQKFDLPFVLLSDPEKELAQAYGVWALKKNYGKEYWGIVRSTFLIGADGKVKREWRGVKVKGHVQAVLEAAGA